jgi:hypothetical protein
MTDQPKAKGGEHGGKARIEGFRENPSIPAITLAQAGIDKNLAHRALCLTKSAAQTAGCPFVASVPLASTRGCDCKPRRGQRCTDAVVKRIQTTAIGQRLEPLGEPDHRLGGTQHEIAVRRHQLGDAM